MFYLLAHSSDAIPGQRGARPPGSPTWQDTKALQGLCTSREQFSSRAGLGTPTDPLPQSQPLLERQ